MSANAGGVAAIIVNNVPGYFSGSLGTPTAPCSGGVSIPAFSLAPEVSSNFADGVSVTATIGAGYLAAYDG